LGGRRPHVLGRTLARPSFRDALRTLPRAAALEDRARRALVSPLWLGGSVLLANAAGDPSPDRDSRWGAQVGLSLVFGGNPGGIAPLVLGARLAWSDARRSSGAHARFAQSIRIPGARGGRRARRPLLS